MELTYRLLTDESLIDDRDEPVCEYGIAVEAGPEWAEVRRISTDKTRVEDMLRKIREHALRPVHLRDVIEDMLGD